MVETESLMDRLEAANALRGSSGREPWPPVYPDPFPDLDGGPPEIGPDGVDEATVVGGVRHHGAVVIRGLLDAAEVDRIRTEMDRARDARLARDLSEVPADVDPTCFAPFRPGENTVGQNGKPHLIRMVDAPRVLAEVLATYRRKGLLDVIESYFDEPPVFTSNKSVLRYLETPKLRLTDFHQDGRFMGADVRAVNVWVTVTDCGTDAPTLDLVPRREPAIAPTGNGTSGFDWTISEVEAEALAAEGGTAVTRLHLRAGDAVVFDHFLVHRSGHAEGMTEMRKAIESWFFAPSHVPWAYQPLRA